MNDNRPSARLFFGSWEEFGFVGTGKADSEGPEKFEPDPCGDASGGFQKGNTCAKGGNPSGKPAKSPAGWGDVGGDDDHAESLAKRMKNIDKFSLIAAKNGFYFMKKGSGFYEAYDAAQGTGKAATAIASFYANKNAIIFNEKNEFYSDPKGYMERMGDTGWFSTNHEDHVIVHEIGHGKHYNTVGEKRYREIKASVIPDDVLPLVKSEVSRYAGGKQGNPLEVVAEMYTAMNLTGKKFSNTLMNYYKSLGGPESD